MWIINKTLKIYLHSLIKLQKLILSFYIKRDFFANRFYYEKKLSEQTCILIKNLKRLRARCNNQVIISRLEHLYELIFSLDLLKNRLIDHSTFEICEPELKNIDLYLSLALQQVVDHKIISEKKSLDVAISSLEIIFENTLQVVTADPILFVFFIWDLYALSEEIFNLQADIKAFNEKSIS